MKISVFGTGIVGRTLAGRLNGLGHEVSIGTRDVDQTLQSDNSDAYGNPPFNEWFGQQKGIELKSFEDSAAMAQLIFNCTNGQGTIAAVTAAGADNVENKIIVDLSNPLDFSKGMPPFLDPVNTDSLGEQLQAAFPKSKVVKTLNTMNTLLMVEPTRLKGNHNVFVSGNDQEAKDLVKELLHSFGWFGDQILDIGDITSARGTEMLLPIWLRLWNTLGTADFNFHIQVS